MHHFMDELDAIGRERSVHLGAVNDEREQTLNQLLAEMDGFEPNAGVIMLAATNRPEVLDRALLRPGRFDRQIVVDMPDLDGREAILKVHAKDKPLAAGVDLRQVAQGTVGFSGADLANVLNEAALFAARRKEREITQTDLEDAIEKVVAGPERKSRRMNDEQKRRVACHEVGHALVAAFSPKSDPVRKITIIPHGHAALGYTLQLPIDDQFLLSRSELLTRIRGMLGGRAAEEVEYGEVTTGAQNDLEHATALARQMVCRFGMSDTVGLANCAQRPPVFLDGQDFQLQRDCSEETATEIDQEVKKILDRGVAIRVNDDVALLAAVAGNQVAMVQFLLQSGAGVHARDDEAVRTAAKRGYAAMAEILIQNGADWHARGDEALIRAARNGFADIVRLLLKTGESCRISREQAWREAVSNGHADVAAWAAAGVSWVDNKLKVEWFGSFAE